MRALSQPSVLFERIALFVLWSAVLGFAVQPAAAQSVVVNSGTSVTFLDSGTSNGDFPAAFTPAQFSAAQAGTAASASSVNGGYITSLPHGPNAVWIGTNASAGTSVGDTALYAASFNLPSTVSSASLTVYYAVDNNLGYTNPGIYINGTALPNTTGLPPSCINNGCAFNQEQTYTAANIAPLLVSGTNWIYFDDVNLGGPAALMFSAVINYSPVSSVATTGDPNILDFTAGIGTYATFSNYSSGDAPAPYTPTSAQLATNAFRVYGGTLNTGLPGTDPNPSNWYLATFPSPVATIVVFPNIDHFGSAYDGYQYRIAGSNDGVNWTLLFDALTVNGSAEPFTLGTYTGTAPTTVNNVLSPGNGPGGTVGYIAQFTFPAAYQYYAFGASTEAVSSGNTDQELSAVGTTSVLQTFNTSGPTTSTFNNTADNLVQQTIDATNTGPLTCNGTSGIVDCGNVQLSSTNTTVSNPTVIPLAAVNGPAAPNSPPFSPFVDGTPWSSALCAGRPGNGGSGDLCSLYVNACYGGNSGVTLAAASDFYCPFVNTATNASGYFVLEDTWDPLSPKPSIAPGTTMSLLDFVPTSPTEIWTGSAVVPNPVCTQVAPISGNPGTPAQCHVVDTLKDVFGDQTTTRGTQPKKGWLISLFNVPMLLSTVQVLSGPGCTSPHSPLNDANPADLTFENPTFAQNIWNNGNCLLAFFVNPAQTPSPNTNNFVAAPPASLFYGPGTPPVVLVGAPQGDSTLANANAVCVGAGVACGALPWSTGGLKTLSSVFGATDGTFILHWASTDTVGTLEKSVALLNNGTCTTGPTPVSAPCYSTTYFTTIVNLDSTKPTVTLTFSPAGGTYSIGQPASATFSCTDPINGGVASGIATCQASVDGGPATSVSPVALNTLTAGPHKVTVTATDNAGNTYSKDFSYTVLPDADVAIFEQHTSDSVKPGGTLTYLAWALDLSKTSAAEVTVTEQIQLPAAGVSLGNVTARMALVACSASGCTTPTGMTACSVSGTTITCNIGTLPSIYTLKGVLIKTSIPVLSTSKPGTAFKITATVNSPNDPNPKNNTTTDLLSICSNE